MLSDRCLFFIQLWFALLSMIGNGTHQHRRPFRVAPAVIADELRQLQGGVVDTSTLIYLDRLRLLPVAARSFSLVLIPGVIREYGGCPPGCRQMDIVSTGTTDEQLCRTAQLLAEPVLSEDRRVLEQTNLYDLPFYNTLMLVIALCVQHRLPLTAYPDIRRRLGTFARYSAEIFGVGDAVYEIVLHRSKDPG
ncbi:MAG: hypothetical protein GXY53_02485 [Desulfobulbus sp.]|nr:hypothetical protein [Desulfobulbus sp.]